jgi:hypothetical protein
MKKWFARFIAVAGAVTMVGAFATPARAASPAGAVQNNNNNPACESIVPFDKRDFTHATKIDNRFLPLVPGTQFVLEGSANPGGGGPATRQIVTTVTDLTKVINGVKTRAVVDIDLNDGEVAEAELFFQAQDNDGRVWNMGEYPEVFENGKFVGAPSTWIAGIKGSEAGQHMLANPKVGIRTYLQGFAPSVDFLDCGKVVKTGQHVCTPTKCYDGVLVIKETSPPDTAAQLKYYAPGVGNIKVEPVNDPEAETLHLVKMTKLSDSALAKVRDKAFQLEKRAYKISSVYQKTPPLQCG